MARPTKQGLEYFPVDCNPDGSLEMFTAENGAEGFGILVMLWQMIYKDEGYFIKRDDDLVLRLRKESLSSIEKIVSTLDNAVKRGLFSEEILKKHSVLTSSGIQKRFFPAAKQKKEVSVIREYLLLDVSKYDNLIFMHDNLISIDENATKKSKGNVNEKKKKTTDDISESIYQSYPKKVDKGHALKAIKSALTKIDEDELLIAVRKYADKWNGKDKQFCKNPATWFNGMCWEDEPLEPQPQIQPIKRRLFVPLEMTKEIPDGN